MSYAAVAVVQVDAADRDALAMWNGTLDLADELPDDGWALVGGLMVQLHAYRYGRAGVRATIDIDVLANSRQQPRSRTETIAEALLKGGFEVSEETRSVDPPTVYRFEREGQVVDVLAPDGLKAPPLTVGSSQTVQIPGGTQALHRAEAVEVRLADGRAGLVRCPNLAGAVLLKARAIRSTSRDQDRGDLVTLLACVEDPIAMRDELSAAERGWLRDAAPRLRLDESDLYDLFSAVELRRARAAYALLTAPA